MLSQPMRINTYLHAYKSAEDRNSQAKVEYLILGMHIFNYLPDHEPGEEVKIAGQARRLHKTWEQGLYKKRETLNQVGQQAVGRHNSRANERQTDRQTDVL